MHEHAIALDIQVKRYTPSIIGIERHFQITAQPIGRLSSIFAERNGKK
jgi:hypothetical protein